MSARSKQRKEEILNNLRAMISESISESGMFDLTMADVAARAEVSVGTLYNHFSGKEDLIIALALDNLERRYDAIQTALKRSNYDEPLMRFLVAQISGWKYAQENPGLMEMEFLTMAKSIWKRSSERLRHDLWNSRHKFGHFFIKLFMEAANQLGVEPGSNEVPHQSFTGIWALSLGTDLIASSTMNDEAIFSPNDRTNFLLENLVSLLVGWGWPREELEHAVKSLSALASFQLRFR